MKQENEKIGENIMVMVRVRPLSNSELNEAKCIKIDGNALCLDTKAEIKQFSFDYIACEQESQQTVFEHAGGPLVNACIQGYNATVFAYGQTGAGKTFTIQGLTEDQVSDPKVIYEQRGLMSRIFESIFAAILKQSQEQSKIEYIVKCSYLEIYKEQIIDLLDTHDESLHLREDLKHGVYVEGLIEEVVENSADLQEILKKGLSIRHVGTTKMNNESSRSHSVLTLTIESKTEIEGVLNIRSSRFHIIDLAGSERQKSTDAAGDRLKEAGNINKSLSVLGNVINSLVEASQGKSRHIHYRDSKLTFLLKDSLGGNSKTVLIANVSPSSSCVGETLSTLNFAKGAKLIKNKAIINEDTVGTVLLLQQQIKKLKAEIAQMQTYKNKENTGIDTPMTSPREPEKSNQIEVLLQSTVDLRASDLLIQEQTLKQRDKKIDTLEKIIKRNEKEKTRDKMVLKLKEAIIEKWQKEQKIDVALEIDSLKAEIQFLRETEERKESNLDKLFPDTEESKIMSQKISEQNEYFQQISQYLKDIAEERTALGDKVKNLEEKLKRSVIANENAKMEAFVTQVKLEYGEKIEEMSKKFLE